MMFLQTGQELDFLNILIELCPGIGIIALLAAGVGIVVMLATRRK